MTSAMATPAMLPSPTVAAITDASAWTDEICPELPPPSGLCRNTRTASGSRRTDTAPERRNR